MARNWALLGHRRGPHDLSGCCTSSDIQAPLAVGERCRIPSSGAHSPRREAGCEVIYARVVTLNRGPGQVIVLNGGSSAGKSTLARTLQELLPETWLTFGVDTFIEALPGRGDSSKSGITFSSWGIFTVTESYSQLEDAWYEALHTLVQAGASIILDEILLSGAMGQRRLRAAFSGVHLTWVGVRCDPAVAAAREEARGDRTPGMAERQASLVHSDVCYDLEVDTSKQDCGTCAQTIAAYMQLCR